MPLFSISTSPVNPSRPCLLARYIYKRVFAHALSLEFVYYHQGNLCHVHVRIELILTRPMIISFSLSMIGSQDLHLFAVVHSHEILQPLMRHVLSSREEALVHAVRGGVIEEVF